MWAIVCEVEPPLDPAQDERRELFRTVMMTGEIDQLTDLITDEDDRRLWRAVSAL